MTTESETSAHAAAPITDASTERVLREVARYLNHLRYGSIEITVHDGQVVAIERRERLRFAPRSPAER